MSTTLEADKTVSNVSLPVHDDTGRAWDKAAAEKRIRSWAGAEEAPNAKYRRAFCWYDSANEDNFTAYKLLIADVFNGEPQVVFKAVAAAMAVLNGGRGGLNIPDSERQGVYNILARYYRKFDQEPPELKAAQRYKAGDRLDVTVEMGLQDVDLKDLNASFYAGEMSDEEWTKKVTERLKAKGLNYGEFDAIISNSGLDSHGERIMLEGIDLSRVKQNAPMPWSHDYNQLPLGSWTKFWKSNGNLMGRGRMDYDIYDFAHTAYKMILRGTLNSVSIGGLVPMGGFSEGDDGELIIDKLVMIEASLVMIGAHPEALIVSRSLGIDASELRKQFNDFTKQALVDKFKHMGNDEVNQAIGILEKLLATLKDAAQANSSAGEAEPKEVRHIKRITLKDSAKAVNHQSERIVRLIKLKKE